MEGYLNRNTNIASVMYTKPIERAIENLRRDIQKTCAVTVLSGMPIMLEPGEQKKECFRLVCEENTLKIQAGDELGFIYGIYEISRRILGITDLWFWNDQAVEQKMGYPVPEGFEYQSRPYRVKYRGWFVNDEVLLQTWCVDGSKDKPWEMVFEALMRLGGNMVIPGTDRNSRKYRKIASDMGLYITHHHAEPLGAEMFARAYPDLEASYTEHEEKFKQLWREGIEEQKDMKVIWNVGFRGQGDCPFWENDPRYSTPASRGELMSSLIKIQYDMVKAADPDAVCCTNLYGETMELYQEGCLKLPEDIIKIWADNGYGKMVTRRQGNHNPRVYSLPPKGDQGNHGIYYHVSFYDLQAANHITMLPNSPEFVKRELNEVFKHGADDFWIINCSNVKPHVYYLDFIAEMWKNGEIDTEAHMAAYIKKYYEKRHADLIRECMKNYFASAVSYGKWEDEHAGEQYSNHVPRMLISQFMRDPSKRAEDLRWLDMGRESMQKTGENLNGQENVKEASQDLIGREAVQDTGQDLKGQVEYYQEHCMKAVKGYSEYLKQCREAALELEEGRKLFEDSVLLQAQIHYGCFRGAELVCKSLLEAIEENYMESFYLAGMARESYLWADQAMRSREHGKWSGFYQNECLTDIKQTAWVLEGLMSYVRNLGDGPHYFKWQREVLYSEEDRRVMLILNMENHLNDQELFSLMREKRENRN